MSSKGMKVIIAGGSIAGLSLALMLEKNGIDFLVLEAYSDIAPQVGASIGLLPNGLRVLDQLGCYEEVIAQSEYPVDKVVFRDSHGKPFWSFENFNEALSGRHGYPCVFFDRRMLIQILYDKIQQKDKILTSERVVTVENHPTHVSVSTKSGKTFTGSFVVGADGIHSAVRQQMWEISQKIDPTWIDPAEKDALPATYACIFGISEGGPGVEKGTMNSVFNEHFSYLVPSGPGEKTYWFLVKNMGKTHFGSEIPRYTKEDEEKVAKEHWDDYITPTLQFSDLYKHKISSVYTTLPEYVYKKWYFQRIVTIGDAAHKFEPLTGQGGNNAIETSASLANHLISALKKSKSDDLTTEEMAAIFEKTQQQREDRTWSLVKQSHARQRMECMETPLLRFVAKYLLPHFPTSIVTGRWNDVYASGVSLDMLPATEKTHAVPFYDELLRQPSARGSFVFVLYIMFAALAAFASRQLFTAMKVNGTVTLLRDAIINRSIGDIDGSLRTSYTGIPSIDKILVTLVAIFFPAIASSRPEQQLQLLYFLSSMLPLIAIFTVEGYRQKNKWSLIASPSIWGILYQLRGIGFIAPLYFAASLFVSRKPSFLVTPGQEVSGGRFILSALMLGFIVPSALLAHQLSFENLNTRQMIIAAWQPAPAFVSFFTYISAKIRRMVKRSRGNNTEFDADDLDYVRAAYYATGGYAAIMHLSVIIACVFKSISLKELFLPSDSFAPVKTLADGVFIFFQNDFLLVTAATFIWSLVSIADLHRSGLSNLDWKVGLFYLIAGYVVIGPGATTAALWYWREDAMSRRKAVK